MVELITAIISAAVTLIPMLISWRAGRDGARASAAEANNDAVKISHAARDRLRTDPDYAERVRERYTTR